VSERYELSDITDLPKKVASLNKEGANLAVDIDSTMMASVFFGLSSLSSLVDYGNYY
jgi:hypothetical protein